MADHRLALLTVVWWAGMVAVSPSNVFPLDACPAGDIANSADGLHCSGLPLEFVTDGVYHMRQSDSSVVKVYCDMTGGRWNEILRRGADAEKTLIAAANQLSFAGEAAGVAASPDRYKGFYGNISSEFFVGTDQLQEFGVGGSGSAYHSELLVELKTVELEYYFSIFNIDSINPLVFGKFIMGTAGNGNMSLLKDSSFSTACSEAWFIGTNCEDLEQVDRPNLMRPLDGTARAGGAYDWPGLEKQLQRISMKVRVNHGRFCTTGVKPELALSPIKMAEFNVDMTPAITTPEVAGKSAMATNITITCKDASKVIITKGQYEQNDYTGISGTKTFNCQRNSPPTAAAYDDLPLSLSAICMTPCKSGYTLVAPTTWTTNIADGTSHSIDRLSCLSPLQGTAGHGPYKAAEQCGTAGEQLLDFPVPKDRLVDIPDGVGLITAMHYSVNSANDNKFMIRDLRGSYFESHQFITTAGGNYKDSDRCVGLFVDDSVEHGTVTRQTACYNETLRFVCMSDVGCAPDQILLNGFCYAKLEAKVKDHEKTCYPDPTKDGGRNGMPAVPSAPLLETLASKPETIATPMAVGAYRRGDGFFQMDDAIPDGVITEVGDANDTRCAVLDKATKQLSAIACNDGDARLVICQYPGLPQEECPTIIKEKYPSATKVDTINPNSIKQVSTITAKNGFNYYEREGLHSLQYKCEGLRDDWKLETKLDSLANPAVSPWDPPQVMACTTDDKSGYPANSNFSVVDKYLIHRCIRPLQTSGSETEQQQTCNHVTPYMFTGGVTDCNECMMDPFSIPPSLPMSSSWDGQSRKLGHQVNYTCTLGLTTSNGTSVQQQTCTLSGWEGEVAPCDTCEWLDSFNSSSMDTSITGGLYFGGMVEMTCLPGLEAADGSVNSSAVCTPDVWNVCHDNFTCDHCHGPPLNHSEVAFVASYDWDGTSRQQNTVVTYTCEGTTVTETGLQLQYQNCTELGWTGEILPCGVCPNEPVNVTEEEATTKVWNGSQTFGAEAWYHCNNGTSTALGNTSQSQTCGTQGWFGLVLPCDSCVGQPINVTGMTAIVSDFSGENTIGAQVTYTCQGPLTTAAGQLSQTLNCTQHGWHGDLLPCEVCPPPPSGNHSTIRAVETSRNDGDRLGSSVTYRCNKNLYTEDGHSEIVAVCENDGWSVCEPEIRCNYCPDLGDVAKYRGTLSWDYEDVRELDTVVTLMCEDGLATPDLKTKQTLTCGLNGWNQAVPCSICTDPAPTPPLSMIPNVTWTVGDATAIYTCTDTKQLPWGLTKFEMTCSPSGWPCAPPCDHCAPLSSPLPPGVAAAAPEDVFNNHGGQASYDCNANLQTAMNQTTQALTCSEDGWEGELLPCDECVGDVTAPSPGQDRTWSGNTTIGTSVIYECLPGKETQENATYQTRNCTAELGWTPPPIPCDLCVPPRDPFLGMTREWDGNRTVNSTVTYSCDGNMTTMANETVQIITCTDDGWSAHVQPCALCRSPIPEAGFSEAGNYTIRNVTSWQDWRLQGAIIEYTCYTGLVQTATCDAGDWEPEELPPCARPRLPLSCHPV